MDLKKTSENKVVRWMFVIRFCVVRLVLKLKKKSAAKIISGRLKEHFDAVKLSKKNFCKAEIALLSRGLKFVLTLNNINEVTLKEN